MEVPEQKRQNVPMIIYPAGKMDAITVSDFSQRFDAGIIAGETNFIVDMSSLSYISSAGLRAILTAFKKAEAQNGKLLLCGLNGQIREAFLMSGFLTYFTTYASVDEALTGL